MPDPQLTDDQLRAVLKGRNPELMNLLTEEEHDRGMVMLQDVQDTAAVVEQAADKAAGDPRESILAPGHKKVPTPEIRGKPINSETSLFTRAATALGKVATKKLSESDTVQGFLNPLSKYQDFSEKGDMGSLISGGRPPLGHPGPTTAQLEALGYADPSQHPPTPGVQIDPLTGRMKASELSVWERLSGHVTGVPGLGQAGVNDPRLEGIKAPNWPEIQAERGRLWREIISNVPGWVAAFADTVPSVVARELAGEEVILRGINNMTEFTGMELYSTSMMGVPMLWFHRKGPGRQQDVAPHDMPHPVEDFMPWPYRWMDQFRITPGEMMLGVGESILETQESIGRGVSSMKRSQEEIIVGGLIMGAHAQAISKDPDLIDGFMSGMLEQVGADQVAFMDPVEREKLYRDRPEVIVDNLLWGTLGTGATLRALGAIPKTYKAWNSVRLAELYLRGGFAGDGGMLMSERLAATESAYYFRQAMRANAEGRATTTALGTQRILQLDELKLTEGATTPALTEAEVLGRQAGKADVLAPGPPPKPTVADEVRAQIISKMDEAMVETTDEQARVKMLADRVLVDSHFEVGLNTEMRRTLEDTLQRYSDFVEFLQEQGPLSPAVAASIERMKDVPHRLAGLMDELGASGRPMTLFREHLDTISRGVQAELKGRVAPGDATINAILDDLIGINEKGLERSTQMLDMIKAYRTKTGSVAPAIPLFAVAAHSLWGEDAANDIDFMQAMGPIALLSMFIPGMSRAARSELIGRVITGMSHRGSKLIRANPAQSGEAFLAALGAESPHYAEAIKELRRVAPEVLNEKNAKGLMAMSRTVLAETISDIALSGANPVMEAMVVALEDGLPIATMIRRARDGTQRALGTDAAELVFKHMSRGLSQGKKPREALRDGVRAVVDAGPNAAGANKKLKLKKGEDPFFNHVWKGEPPKGAPIPAAAPPLTREAFLAKAAENSARTHREVVHAIGGSALGAGVAGAATYAAAKGEVPMWAPTAILFGGVIGFGVSRYLANPAFKLAVKKVIRPPGSRGIFNRTRDEFAGDEGELFRRAFIDLLPETIDPNAALKAAGPIGGAVGGAVGLGVGLTPGERLDSSPGFAAFATGATAVGGVVASRMLIGRIFKGPMKPRLFMERLLLADRGAPSTFTRVERRFANEAAGHMAEIRSIAEKLDKMGPDIGAQVDDFLRGNRAIETLPAAAQEVAIRTRLAFDEISLLLVETGIAQGVTKDVVLSNLGNYLPRMYMAFQKGKATDLLDQLETWAQIKKVPRRKLGDLNFLKERKDLPKEVREALGEIIDNPAFLLAKHGMVTGQDIHNMKLMNYIASSEHIIPESVAFRLGKSIQPEEIIRFARENELPVPDPNNPFAFTKAKLGGQRTKTGKHSLDAGGSRRSISAEEHEQILGSIDEAQIDLAGQIRKQELGGMPEPEFFKQFGTQQAFWNGKLYTRMPVDKKWGPLSGRFVDKSLGMDQLVKSEGTEGILQLFKDLHDAPLGFFKKSKVLWSFPTLVRNMVSNVILLDLAGVSPAWRAGTWRTAIREFPLFGSPEGSLFVEARKAGTFGGEFNAEVGELLRGMTQRLSPTVRQSQTLFPGLVENLKRISPLAGKAADNVRRKGGLLKRMERFHQASEQIAKMVAYTHARRNLGLSIEDSSRFAKRWIFDYTDASDLIKYTRKSILGMPFITFAYKSIPRVAETALAGGDPMKAARFWKWPVMIGAFNEFQDRKLNKGEPKENEGIIEMLSRIAGQGLGLGTAKRIAQSGLGIGDPHGFKRFLPTHAGPSQVLWPQVDMFGRQSAVDATYYLPWGNFGEYAGGPLGRNLEKVGLMYPQFLEPGHPWMHTAVGWLTNKDAFTGRDIFPAEATPLESAAAMAKYQLRLWGPPLGPTGFGMEKLRRAWGSPGADPWVPDKPTAVAAEFFGVRRRPFDPSQSFNYAFRELKRQDARLQGQFKYLQRIGAPEWTINNRIWARVRLINAFEERFPEGPPLENQALETAIGVTQDANIEKNSEAVGKAADAAAEWLEEERRKRGMAAPLKK